MNKLRLGSCIAAVLLLAACGKDASAPSAEQAATTAAAPAAEEKVLNIYNWSDYIAEDTIANFEQETGIKVVYDVFDSNELVEAKLVSGNTGYDLVVPSLQYLARQVQAGVFQPLDKSKLSNYGNLDPEIMARIATLDPDNKYALNWLWGTTGIGYNVDKVKQALGDNAPVDSWDLVFKPENISKLKGCGVAVLDTPQELLTTALNYLGEDPNSFDEAVIAKAEALMTSIRPYITEFNSSEYINELANGDICLAVGWSGDVFQAKSRAEEAGNGVNVAYVIPKEGAPMWFDMMAIPKDAKHPDNAHLFLNYILRPEVMAAISNAVQYASANKASIPLVDKAVLENPGVYPAPETMHKLFTFAVMPPEVDRLFTRIWTKLKTGK
ncbi:MAG: extracellular solute-binding protein [Xanthomonadaceae bacterium]|nr:extracellular solute-binding protein [Xanthomonadaceae bacterium]